LAELRTTVIGALVSDDLKEDAVTLSERVASMKTGGTADMQLKTATPFWLQVQARLHWFFQFQIADDSHPTGSIKHFASKHIRGVSALESALKILARDSKDGRIWELKTLQQMRPWAHTFDEVQKLLFGEGVKDSVAKCGWKVDGIGLIKPSITGAIEDAHDVGAMVKSSGSSSTLAMGTLECVPLADTPSGKRPAKKSKSEISREALRQRVLRSLQGVDTS
jgi:hypothetical protein